jgi:hypothetical protein
MKRSGLQRVLVTARTTALGAAELAIVDGGRFSSLFGGGKSKSSPSSSSSGSSAGTPGKQSSAETWKQAGIFGVALTGAGIAGQALFPPDQGGGQAAAPPPSAEPLDYL